MVMGFISFNAKQFMLIVIIIINCHKCLAGTKAKKHNHSGVLTPFSGKHIGYKVTYDDAKILDKGNPVS